MPSVDGRRPEGRARVRRGMARGGRPEASGALEPFGQHRGSDRARTRRAEVLVLDPRRGPWARVRGGSKGAVCMMLSILGSGTRRGRDLRRREGLIGVALLLAFALLDPLPSFAK